MNTRLWLPVIGFLIVSLTVAACAPAAPTPAPAAPTTAAPSSATPASAAPAPTKPVAARPIRIASLVPLSGPVAAYGPKFNNGIAMALKKAGNQVLGRPIELIREDSAADPVVALEKAKKLVEVDNVHVIIGPLMGHVHLAIADYLEAHNVTSVTLKTSPADPSAQKSFIIYPTTDKTLTYPWGVYAAETLGYKKATALFSDYVAGRNFYEGFKRGFEEKGGTIIQEQWAPIGTVDFGPYLTAIKPGADVFVTWMPSGDMMNAISQYVEFGLPKKVGPMLVGAMSFWASEMQQIGDPILGAVGPVDYSVYIDTPANKSWVAAFKAEYGTQPDIEEYAAYEATLMALAAIEAAGGDEDKAKLRQAFLNLKLDLPAGQVSVSPSGVVIKDLYIAEAKRVDGQIGWVPIKKFPAVRPLEK